MDFSHSMFQHPSLYQWIFPITNTSSFPSFPPAPAPPHCLPLWQVVSFSLSLSILSSLSLLSLLSLSILSSLSSLSLSLSLPPTPLGPYALPTASSSPIYLCGQFLTFDLSPQSLFSCLPSPCILVSYFIYLNLTDGRSHSVSSSSSDLFHSAQFFECSSIYK